MMRLFSESCDRVLIAGLLRLNFLRRRSYDFYGDVGGGNRDKLNRG